MDLEIDDLTTGRRPLADSDSSDVTAYDPNSRLVMVDDPVTGRRPAKTIADLFAYSGDHLHTMVDSLTSGRVPITIGAVSVWSPSALFAASEVGVWYDPSDLTTMFQDSAGTTPVTATGQPVGKILDKSGNGKHASQATAASRPVYRDVGGYKYLEFDGVDDSLATAAIDFTATDKVSIFTGVNRVLNTAGRKTIVMGVGDCNSANGSFELDTPTDPSTTGTWCRGTQISGLQFAPTAAHAVLTAQYDLAGGGYVSNTKLRENAVALVGVYSGNSTTGGGNFGNGIIRIGAIVGASGYFGGYIYSIIVRGALSDSTQIDDAESYVNSKTGAY